MVRYLSVGIVLALAAACGSHLAVRHSPEPAYAGKTISQWLDAGYEDAAMALQQVGPSAGPYVLAKLAREDPRYGTCLRYQRFWTKVPASVRLFFPRPAPANFNDLRATSALLELGSPIKPVLGSGLADDNPAVRIACARTLGLLRLQGSDIRKALPGLARATRDANRDVATAALKALADDEAFQGQYR